VVCAVDCGTPINPDVIAAQMEGGIGFGLSAALYAPSRSRRPRGAVQLQQLRVLRMNEMPKVEVHIVPSTEAPTGVGEPGVAPIGPAVANAIFAASGRRVRIFPSSKVRPDRQACLLRSSRSKPMAPPGSANKGRWKGMAVSSPTTSALMSAESRSSPYHARCAL